MGHMEFRLDEIMNKLKASGKNLTNAELSRMTGIRPNTIGNIRDNKSVRLESEFILLILDALNDHAVKHGISKTYTVEDLIYYTYKK